MPEHTQPCLSLHLLPQTLIEARATVDHITSPHTHSYLLQKLPDVTLSLVAAPQLACSVAKELANATAEAQEAIGEHSASNTPWDDTEFITDDSSLYLDSLAPPGEDEDGYLHIDSWGRLFASETMYADKRPLKLDSGLSGMLAMRNMEQGEVRGTRRCCGN